MADDHINLKSLAADPSGRVFAAVKTERNANPNAKPGDPLNILLVLGGTGAWNSYVFGTVADNHTTRPVVLLRLPFNEVASLIFGAALLWMNGVPSPDANEMASRPVFL